MYTHIYVYIYTNKNIYAYICIHMYKTIKNRGEVFERARRREWCIGWFGERKKKRENDVIVF